MAEDETKVQFSPQLALAEEGTAGRRCNTVSRLKTLSQPREKHAKAKGAFPKKDASAQSSIWTGFYACLNALSARGNPRRQLRDV
jgi:hypothetical protein